MKKKLRKLITIIDIILLIICMTIIFWFSSETASKSLETTNKVTTKTVETITDKDSSKKKDKKEIDDFIEDNLKLIRKTAHLIEYCALGFLIVNVFKDYKKITIKICGISLLCAFLYACTDEIHQMFIPERTALIGDIIVDSLGSLLGIIIFYMIYKFINKYVNRQSST